MLAHKKYAAGRGGQTGCLRCLSAAFLRGVLTTRGVGAESNFSKSWVLLLLQTPQDSRGTAGVLGDLEVERGGNPLGKNCAKSSWGRLEPVKFEEGQSLPLTVELRLSIDGRGGETPAEIGRLDLCRIPRCTVTCLDLCHQRPWGLRAAVLGSSPPFASLPSFGI